MGTCSFKRWLRRLVAYCIFTGLPIGDVVFSLNTCPHTERLRPQDNHNHREANDLMENHEGESRGLNNHWDALEVDSAGSVYFEHLGSELRDYPEQGREVLVGGIGAARWLVT